MAYSLLLLLLFIGSTTLIYGELTSNECSILRSNSEICDAGYPYSPVENFVCNKFGENLPNMRDELLERKENGEGFVRRHINAYRNPENWDYDVTPDILKMQRPRRSISSSMGGEFLTFDVYKILTLSINVIIIKKIQNRFGNYVKTNSRNCMVRISRPWTKKYKPRLTTMS